MLIHFLHPGRFLRSPYQTLTDHSFLVLLEAFARGHSCTMIDRGSMRNLRSTAFILFTIALPLIYAIPTPLESIPVPSSVTCTRKLENDRAVCCWPSKWTDILIFYATNYLAHAATTKSYPGQTDLEGLLTVVVALLFPLSGALRGLEAVVIRAKLASTDLQTAAKAGALYVVVETPDFKIDDRHSRNTFSI